jgi:pimeloyl-ACP methyl ester carboxylesterase
MRTLAPFSALATLAAVVPAVAQDKPATTTCPSEVAAIATCYGAKHASGAYLLAAVPKDWNGNLVVFARGGPAVVPPTATTSQNDLAKYAFLVKMGYAWVASSYRREGYGVAAAAEDTEHARQFFVEHLGKPKRTIMHGASWGGLVGTMLVETYGKNFDGAMFNSGFVAGSPVGYEFRADLRVVYQHYCKNLPRPNESQYPLWQGLPTDAKMTLKQLEALVDECTGVMKPAAERTDAQKQNLANIVGVMRFPEIMLVRHMQSATFLFREIAERTTGGKSAFSNRDVRYGGSSNDEDLNKNIERFDADPAALAALKADGEAKGALPIPVVSIHSFNDPQVAVEVQSHYRDVVRNAGAGDRLVQAYTDERGHTAQGPSELGAKLQSLMQWVESGTKPTPRSILATCEQLREKLGGPCNYKPEYQPKAYNTRYARGVQQAAGR